MFLAAWLNALGPHTATKLAYSGVFFVVSGASTSLHMRPRKPVQSASDAESTFTN